MFGKVLTTSVSLAVSRDQCAQTLSSACGTPQRSLYSSERFLTPSALVWLNGSRAFLSVLRGR